MLKWNGRLIAAGCAALAVGALPIVALASGGGMSGGGASMPSVSGPEYDPTVEYKKAVEALKAGNYKEADRYLGHVLDVVPDNAQVLFLQGIAKDAAGDQKGAERVYEKVLKLDPQNIPARRESAIVLTKLGQADKAKAQSDILKTRMAACGDACPEAADLKTAVAAVKEASTPPTGGPTAPATAGAAPAPAPEPASGAVKAPASLLLTDPASGDRSYVTAVRLINQHRYADALVALRQASAVFGPHPDVLTYTGYTYRKLHDYDRAETFYKQALSIAPNHVGATEYYGELMVERGDMAGAKRMLTKLETICSYGCVESEDLRQWIEHGPPAS